MTTDTPSTTTAADDADRVPVIDISGWANGTPDQRTSIARAVGDACANSGFYQVIGHGVAASLI